MLNDILNSHDITRIPLPPTRITDHCETSTDIMATNMNLAEIETESIMTGLSDHTGRLSRINLESNKEIAKSTT